MKVLISGLPKSGLHATQKACELLGINAEWGHWTFAEGFPEGGTHHIYIKRDPRNVIISRLRFDFKSVTSGTFVASFRDFDSGISFADTLQRYVEWLSAPNVFVLRYEDLIASDAAIRSLADYLDVPYLDDAFPNLPGYTITWNDVPSDYRTIWSPEVEAVWNAEGGPELLARWGYG